MNKPFIIHDISFKNITLIDNRSGKLTPYLNNMFVKDLFSILTHIRLIMISNGLNLSSNEKKLHELFNNDMISLSTSFINTDLHPIEKDMLLSLHHTRLAILTSKTPSITFTSTAYLEYISSSYKDLYEEFQGFIKHMFYFIEKKPYGNVLLTSGMMYPITTLVDNDIFIEFFGAKSDGVFTSYLDNNIDLHNYLKGFSIGTESSTASDYLSSMKQFCLLLSSLNHPLPYLNLNVINIFRYFVIDRFGLMSRYDPTKSLSDAYRTDILRIFFDIFKDEFSEDIQDIKKTILKKYDRKHTSEMLNFLTGTINLLNDFYDTFIKICNIPTHSDNISSIDVEDTFARLDVYIIDKLPQGMLASSSGYLNFAKEADDPDVEPTDDQTDPPSDSQTDTEDDVSETEDMAADEGGDDFDMGDDDTGDSESDDTNSSDTSSTGEDEDIKTVEDEFLPVDDTPASISTFIYKLELYRQLIDLSKDIRLAQSERRILFEFASKFVFKAKISLTEMLLKEVMSKLKPKENL